MGTMFSESELGLALDCPLKHRAYYQALQKAGGLFGRFKTTHRKSRCFLVGW